MASDQQWHLSKALPISIILAVLTQTIALVWYIASLDAAVGQHARELARHEARIEVLETIVQGQSVSIARMDANIQAIREIVERSVRN